MPMSTAGRSYRSQKAGLTRAINSGDRDKLIAECRRTVREWDTWQYGWPDDWARWQSALDDAFPVFHAPRLEALR